MDGVDVGGLLKRLGDRPWPRCRRCGEEYLVLRASGMCGNCDPPPPHKQTVTESKKQKDREFLDEVTDGSLVPEDEGE